MTTAIDPHHAGREPFDGIVLPQEQPANPAPATDEPAASPRRAAATSAETARAKVGAVEVLQLACWAGLMFGILEAGYFAFSRFVLGGVPPAGIRLFWMCPVTQAATFLVLSVPFVLLIACTRNSISLGIVVCWLVFLGTTGLAFLIPGIHPIARLILAGGVAVQAWRCAERRGPQILRFSDRTRFGSLLVVLGVIAAVEGSRWLGERRATNALPATTQNAPNVLFIVLDTVRAESVDLGGKDALRETSANTPNLRRLAAEGAVFERAIAPAPWTLPSHASMFTGRHPYELSARWFASLDDTYPTLAERLQEEGYVTAGFVANTRFCRAETGLARGFIHYEDYAISPGQFLLSAELGRRLVGVKWVCYDFNQVARKSADHINEAFLRWLDRTRPDGRPFFAFLNYFDAHDPYVAPAKSARRPPETDAQRRIISDWWYIDKSQLTADEIDFSRANYEDCIHYLDDRLGELFEGLEQRGLLAGGLVIVTSDHGEHFGDHALFGHGNSLYQPVLHVPLVIRFPGRVPAGKCFDQVVGLRELPATVLHLLGLEDHLNGGQRPRERPFPGESLSRFWEASNPDATHRDIPVISSIAEPAEFPPCHGRSPVFLGPMKSVVEGDFKYIRAGEHEELYNIRRDAAELHDLIGDRRFEAKLKSLRSVLPGAPRGAG
jgi:arylsulfatase A-like enzyme